MDPPLRALSLCAGIGGLDLAARRVLGARTIGLVERDAAALEVLAARMEEGSLDPAPAWSDLATFDGRPWRGAVDLILAGYPCPPFSSAGLRRGERDTRHLWPEVARIIREVGPSVVVLENVAGHLRLGFDQVLGDLAALGFDAEWATVRASDAGAPHRRERVFVLAYTRGRGFESLRRCGIQHQERTPHGHDPDRCGPHMGWPLGPRGDWAGVPEHLWPATEPIIRGGADGAPGRLDRLRLLGNAVCPPQATLALEELLSRVTHA